jgi:hypothetical protein
MSGPTTLLQRKLNGKQLPAFLPCSLNINAWANYAPTEDVAALQRVQTLEGLALATPDRPITHLHALGACSVQSLPIKENGCY